MIGPSSLRTDPFSALVSTVGKAFRRDRHADAMSVSITERDNIITARFTPPLKYDGSIRTLIEGLVVEQLTYESISAQKSPDGRPAIIASLHVDCVYELYALRNLLTQTGLGSAVEALEGVVHENWKRTYEQAVRERDPFSKAMHYRRDFQERGVCVVPWEEGPLSQKEWFLIESAALRLPTERTVVDPAFARAQIMRNGVIAAPTCQNVASVFKAPHIADFVREVTGTAVRAADAQVNVLEKGDYLSGHTHDFEAPFSVLHLNHEYEGGHYREGESADVAQRIDISARAWVISEGARFHEVEPVTSGRRLTIPLFFKAC